MNKTQKYLRMKTPSDLLAVNFCASSGQLKGRFVQETEPPWTIWWEVAGEQGFIGRLGSMIQGQIEAPETVWEAGTPGSELKTMEWVDLFRKSVIRPEDTRRVADEVILMTADREIFFAALKNHFVLQQGHYEFAVFDARREYFMLRITRPSLWVFNTLAAEGFTWFNQLEGHSGIYVEAGWRIHDISSTDCFNQFKIIDGGVLLVQKDGRLLNLKPSWKKGESIIKVDFGEIKIPQKEQSEGLVIKPGLRTTDRHTPDVFWKIEDRERLKAIIANESLKSFSCYRCWACSDGRVYIYVRDDSSERALATILSDAFAGFSEVESRVMAPSGHLLTPRLSSERLHKLFSAQPNDFICFEKSDDPASGINCIILRHEDMLNIEDFITLEVEGAIDRANTKKPGWEYEFKELKKKKQSVLIEVKNPVYQKLEAASEDGQAGQLGSSFEVSGKKRKPTSLNLGNVAQLSDNDIAQLRLRINEIDRQLNENATDAQLWRERGDVARRMRLPMAALASTLNAAALSFDIPLMHDCAVEYSCLKPELSLMRVDKISEVDKGRLLAAIRSDEISAEFHYVLLLTYAARFNDRDIFNQALAGMKSGFVAEKKLFHNFSETRVAGGGGMNVENRVELLTIKDMPRITMNVRKYLLQVGCCSSTAAISLAKRQLAKMMSVHLNEESARRLVGNIDINMPSYSRFPTNNELSRFAGSSNFNQMIDSWPASAASTDGLSVSMTRWIKLLTMDRIRETPLRDFFTGELYKPPFMFNKAEEETCGLGILKNVSWMRKLENRDFPDSSDGKPIARAIYDRFSSGDSDWADFFRLAKKSNDMNAMARSQRLLLLMVSEFGPHPAFAEYIAPATIEPDQRHGWDIFSLTMYCDMFRLSLAYKKPVDEQRLFNLLINRIPQPPRGWEDFRDSAEWIILCLLLTSSPVRRFQLDNLTARAMRWLAEGLSKSDSDVVAETLTVLCFLGIGTLADLVPEKLEFHQLLEKRRVFWIQHAFAHTQASDKAFKDWLSAANV